MTMKVEIKDNKLFIEIDLEEPTRSSSVIPLLLQVHIGISLLP